MLLVCSLVYSTPKGLEDVSKYPALFAELIRRGYSESDISKIARRNFIRVFKAVEKVNYLILFWVILCVNSGHYVICNILVIFNNI